MRPTPSETIAGVRRLLGEVLDTCEIDDYARSRLSEIDAALGQVDWDDALTEVAAANAATAELIRSGLEWMDSHPPANLHAIRSGWERRYRDAAAGAGAARTGPELEALLSECVAPAETFARHNARFAATQATAVDLSDYVAEWCRAHPGDAAATALLDRFTTHYSARRKRSAAPGK
ncbi:MAG TPA: hypothetical protein VG435_18065 [Acidimicrobiales bacterium]|jgi:hypothetical protein|nr:hypothetical protein [Acidimicrobiales bacterium]